MGIKNCFAIILSLLFFMPAALHAFDRRDSIRIETLLAEGQLLKNNENRMLYFGRKFIGVPYVAHTLDRDTEESIVVNTRELDCTTFVETVTALTLCSQRGEKRFADYCRQLQLLRYEGGKCQYVKRNHYFTGWIEANAKAGFVSKVQSTKAPFTAVQNVMVNWMTNHVSSYYMLNAHHEWIDGIKKMEASITGRSYRYIPKSAIKNTKLVRATIKDGDIIAILTTKKGLDTTHIGIAVWHKDGLHLLNASSVYKKVVEDSTLFSTYLSRRSYNQGIRLCRVKS